MSLNVAHAMNMRASLLTKDNIGSNINGNKIFSSRKIKVNTFIDEFKIKQVILSIENSLYTEEITLRTFIFILHQHMCLFSLHPNLN